MASRNQLTIQQRQVLMLLAAGKTVTEACRDLDIEPRMVQRWQRQANFKDALDGLFTTEDIMHLKSTLNIAAAGTVEVLEDAMANAVQDKSINCTCPSCGTKFTQYFTVRDYRSSLHAVDTLLKMTGLLTERRESKIDITHHVQLSWAENLARLRYREGYPISPQMEQRLADLGQLPERPQLTEGSIEAEFSEVDGEPDSNNIAVESNS